MLEPADHFTLSSFSSFIDFRVLLFQKYLSFKASPCPIMIEKATPPRLFPIEVERSLYQADIIFNAYQGEQGLVSYICAVKYSLFLCFKTSPRAKPFL